MPRSVFPSLSVHHFCQTRHLQLTNSGDARHLTSRQIVRQGHPVKQPRPSPCWVSFAKLAGPFGSHHRTTAWLLQQPSSRRTVAPARPPAGSGRRALRSGLPGVAAVAMALPRRCRRLAHALGLAIVASVGLIEALRLVNIITLCLATINVHDPLPVGQPTPRWPSSPRKYR